MKNFKITIILKILVFLIFTQIGCKKDSPIKNSPIKNSAKYFDATYFDFTNTQNIFCTSEVNDSSNLYKLTSSNEIKQIQLRDKKDSISKGNIVRVKSITKFTDKFLLLKGDFRLRKETLLVFYSNILVRISDGYIFNFGDDFELNASTPYYNYSPQIDKYGSIYYSSKFGSDKIKKIVIDDSCIISRSEISILPDYWGFWVTNDGDILKKSQKRIYFYDGGFDDFDLGEATIFWTGINKKSYIFNLIDSTMSEMTINSKQIKYSKIASFFRPIIDDREFFDYKILRKQEVIFFCPWIGIFKFNEETMTTKSCYFPKEFDGSDNNVPGNGWGASCTVTDNYVFFANKKQLLRVSLDDFSSKILNFPDYYFTNISTNINDNILFLATKYSDSKKIIGKIDLVGNSLNIFEGLTYDILFLEKL